METSIRFPTRHATLLREIDKRVMVSLRDGRSLIGYLRTIDQFGNLVLHRTVERIHVGNKYGDIPQGVSIIRGENVVLVGEIDPYKELTQPLIKIDIDEIVRLKHIETEAKKERNKIMSKLIKGKSEMFGDFGQDDVY